MENIKITNCTRIQEIMLNYKLSKLNLSEEIEIEIYSDIGYAVAGVGGAVAIAAGGATWYYRKKKKKAEAE